MVKWYVQIIITLAGALIGWVFGKLKTPRENKKSDIELIKSAITPLLTSIKAQSDHSNELVGKLLAEQEKNLRLIEENRKLTEENAYYKKKVECLERRLTKLTEKVNKIAKNEKDLPIADAAAPDDGMRPE